MSPRQPKRPARRVIPVHFQCDLPPSGAGLPGHRFMIRMTYCHPENCRLGVNEDGFQVKVRPAGSPTRPAYSHETIDVWWEQVPAGEVELLRRCGYEIQEWLGYSPVQVKPAAVAPF